MQGHDDFTFSPVQGVSPAATPRSGAPQQLPDAFGALLARSTSSNAPELQAAQAGGAPATATGRHRRHSSASAGGRQCSSCRPPDVPELCSQVPVNLRTAHQYFWSEPKHKVFMSENMSKVAV